MKKMIIKALVRETIRYGHDDSQREPPFKYRFLQALALVWNIQPSQWWPQVEPHIPRLATVLEHVGTLEPGQLVTLEMGFDESGRPRIRRVDPDAPRPTIQ